MALLSACGPPTVPAQSDRLGREPAPRPAEAPEQVLSVGGNRYLGDVPYVKQGDDNTCGQAVATMMLRYWGQDVDYQTVVNESNPLNLGTSHAALQTYLRARGLQAQAYREGSLELLRSLIRRGRPVIALLDFGGLALEHYVVVVGYNETQNSLIFHDSSTGFYRRLTAEDFLTRWANEPLVKLPFIGGADYRYLMFDVGPALEPAS